jgi:hypothetical protein
VAPGLKAEQSVHNNPHNQPAAISRQQRCGREAEQSVHNSSHNQPAAISRQQRVVAEKPSYVRRKRMEEKKER